MDKYFVDICIIGSGVSALGAVMGVKGNDNIKKANICLIADDRDRVDYYDSGQILRYLGFGGTGKYWHGVIPTYPLSEAKKNIFQFFFGDMDYIWGRPMLFVPRSPIRPNFYIRQLIEKEEYIRDSVNKLILADDGVYILLNSGKKVFAKSVYCAAGVIGTLGILYRSNIINNEITIGDHICGFVGFIGKDDIEGILGEEVKPIFGRKGYAVPCMFSDDGRTLFSFRPSRFEMKEVRNQLRGGPKFSVDRKKLILEIFKSKSIGRISEALSLRYGMLFSADKYSIHFQYECKEAHLLDLAKERLYPSFKDNDVLRNVLPEVNKIFGIQNIPPQKFYYGTHLFGAMGLPSIPPEITIVDSTLVNSIGGGHHSFSQMAYAKEVLSLGAIE